MVYMQKGKAGMNITEAEMEQYKESLKLEIPQ